LILKRRRNIYKFLTLYSAIADMEISGKSFHLNLSIDDMTARIWAKFLGAGHRVLSYLRNLPVRLRRLGTHLWKGMLFLRPLKRQKWVSGISSIIAPRIGMWWLELFIYILDSLGIPELYETIMDFVKFNTRALYKWEIALARSVFGNAIDYRRVRIDEYSFAGPRQKKFCYVSFYVINSWGSMQNSIFIHEMTHVWQFEKMGSVYIPHALKAQQSEMGYNYGGVSALKACQEKGKSFRSFNLEQQGDIISDYYRIRDGYQPLWGNGSRHDLPIYESFVDQLKNG
jgi:hypothetical protein